MSEQIIQNCTHDWIESPFHLYLVCRLCKGRKDHFTGQVLPPAQTDTEPLITDQPS